MLALGAVIFMAGCGYAVYRDLSRDMEADLERESRTSVVTLMSVYGGMSGALSVEELDRDPGLISGMEPFSGKVAKITVRTPETDEMVFRIPDDDTFDDHPRTLEERQEEKVAVNLGNGRIVPGDLEVVLYDG